MTTFEILGILGLAVYLALSIYTIVKAYKDSKTLKLDGSYVCYNSSNEDFSYTSVIETCRPNKSKKHNRKRI